MKEPLPEAAFSGWLASEDNLLQCTFPALYHLRALGKRLRHVVPESYRGFCFRNIGAAAEDTTTNRTNEARPS